MKIFSFFFFFFFWKAIKIAGSAHKNRVGRVSGNSGFVCVFLGVKCLRVQYY